MTPFDVCVVRTGWAAVAQVGGELDLSTATQLDEQLMSLADEGRISGPGHHAYRHMTDDLSWVAVD